MTRKDENIILKTLIRAALHQNGEMTAKEITEWINKHDYKLLHLPTANSIHRIVNANKGKNGYLNDIKVSKKDKLKSYFIGDD